MNTNDSDREFESLSKELGELPYRRSRTDLWPAVQAQIQRDQSPFLNRWLWPVGVVALGWRGVQLIADVPSPALVTLLPLAVAALVVWRAGSGLLAIETWAPELRERGI